ncbi:hypothetical protein GCM10028862_08390 [Luteimonas pelagia]
MPGDGVPTRPERRREREERPAGLRWIARARSLVAVLDLMPNALLLLEPDARCRIWHANVAAQRRLQAGYGLRVVDDRLVVDGPGLDARLQQLARACTRPGTGASLDLPVPCVAGTPLRLRLEALDFGASADLPVQRLVLAEVLGGGLDTEAVAALCRAHGLTRKEAEAALMLHATGSVAGIAAQSGRSVHTVRTQLKAAMAKTGTHSQAALVALVGARLRGGSLPPVAPTPRGR